MGREQHRYNDGEGRWRRSLDGTRRQSMGLISTIGGNSKSLTRFATRRDGCRRWIGSEGSLRTAPTSLEERERGKVLSIIQSTRATRHGDSARKSEEDYGYNGKIVQVSRDRDFEAWLTEVFLGYNTKGIAVPGYGKHRYAAIAVGAPRRRQKDSRVQLSPRGVEAPSASSMSFAGSGLWMDREKLTASQVTSFRYAEQWGRWKRVRRVNERSGVCASRPGADTIWERGKADLAWLLDKGCERRHARSGRLPLRALVLLGRLAWRYLRREAGPHQSATAFAIFTSVPSYVAERRDSPSRTRDIRGTVYLTESYSVRVTGEVLSKREYDTGRITVFKVGQ
ncbi:hypothetical protein DFP72DRAFT_1142953 [Ephemerocybe angulata]|uniref:Uncharacterized protein n=1 Tax=Ephemerocybe angulata TaxID=980116 RepID=A0A8H6HN02_9AGAR|nr:hypothetical protein DFP72DRAFT_1142953 [Tulosesus angulatus]